jgi:hypothetical protein
MLIRTTSAAAYRYITSTGVISERRRQFYVVLYKHGPLTGGECLEKIEHEFGYRPYSSSHGRLTELRDRGVVKECGRRVCTLTNQEVILWDVTDSMPIDPKKDLKTRIENARMKAIRARDRYKKALSEWKALKGVK